MNVSLHLRSAKGLVSLKADSNTRIWGQGIYLGRDTRKPQEREEKQDTVGKGRRPTGLSSLGMTTVDIGIPSYWGTRTCPTWGDRGGCLSTNSHHPTTEIMLWSPNFLELTSAPQVSLTSGDLNVAGCWNWKLSQEHMQEWLVAGPGHMRISWGNSGDIYCTPFLTEGTAQGPWA